MQESPYQKEQPQIVYKVVRDTSTQFRFISVFAENVVDYFPKEMTYSPADGSPFLFAFSNFDDARKFCRVYGISCICIWKAEGYKVRKQVKLFPENECPEVCGDNFFPGTVFCSAIKLLERA